MYIEKRLNNKYDSSDIKKIVDAILESSDIANSRQLLGIPLQLYIITENFLTNENLFSTLRQESIFVLTTMYKCFFEGKKEFLFKKTGMDQRLEQIGFSFKHHLKQYKVPSLRICLDDETFEKLNLDECDSQEFLEDIKTKGDKFGIIKNVNAENMPVFFHQTYAEYFACVWFARNLNQLKLLRKEWFLEKYQNLRLMFDIMVSEQSPLHLAVIYSNLQQFRKCVEKHQEDKAGRNALYLACCYGMKYPLPRMWKDGSFHYTNCHLKRESEIYIEIVHSLLEQRKNIFEEDTLFDMNYIDYALSSRCLYIIEACLERKLVPFGEIHQLLQEYYDFETLAFYASQMDYNHLLQIVLKRVDYDTTFNYVWGNWDVFDYVAYTPRSLLYVAIVGSKDQHQIIPRKENVKSVETILNRGNANVFRSRWGKTRIHDQLRNGPLLRLTCYLGSYKIMKILSTYQTTWEGNDIFHMTLEYGTLNDDVLELSKTIGLDVNKKNQNGETPLYIACSKGNEQHVEKLLDFGAEMDVQNGKLKDNVFHVTAKLEKENTAIMQMLLNKRKSLANVPDKDGCYPLFFACKFGHIKYVKLLLKNGVNTNFSDNFGNTVLHYTACALNDFEEIINISLKSCININMKNSKGEIALHWACQTGVFNNVKLLIDRGSDINARSDDGNSCLHYAAKCCNENTETIKFLVDNNLEVNSRNNEGDTPLNIVCKYGTEDKYNDVRIFLENGADGSIMNEAGQSSLHCLSVTNNQHNLSCEIITLLLDKGHVDINNVDRNGNTALNLAIDKKINSEIVEVLLERGADPNISDINGRNALHKLCTDIGFSKHCSRNIDLLINHGININAQDNHGRTPLHLLSSYDDNSLRMEITEDLLKTGADVNISDHQKMTALHYEANNIYSKVNFLKLLVKYGANLNLQNSEGQTPQHLAVKHRNWNKFEALLKSGADINVVDNEGRNVLHYVAYYSDAKFRGLLIDQRVEALIKTNHARKVLTEDVKEEEKNILKIFTNKNVVNAQNVHGETPLHLAFQNQELSVVKSLRENGANENLLTLEKRTMLHYAAESWYHGHITELLQKGFDKNAQDVNGTSILHCACRSGHLRNIQILLSHNTNIHVRDNKQQTILHYAAMSPNPERDVMNYLVKTGIDIYAKNSNGKNAVDVAFECKCFNALQLLIKTKKFFDPAQLPWSKLLYYSAFSGSTHGIKYLIENCGNISDLDCNKEFPLNFLKSDGVLQNQLLWSMTLYVGHLIITYKYDPLQFIEYIKFKISKGPIDNSIFEKSSEYARFIEDNLANGKHLH